LSAQVQSLDKLTIKTGGTLKIKPGASFELNSYGITGISNDSTGNSRSSVKLITEKAAIAYADTKDPSTTNELGDYVAASSAPSSPKQGDHWWKNTTDSIFVRDGGAWVFFSLRAPSGGGSGISGLTTNKLAKATSSTEIGNSQLSDDGTTVLLTGSGKAFQADSGASLKGENLFVERTNNSTSTAVINMTTNPVVLTLPAGTNDLVKFIVNSTSASFRIDPNGAETIGGSLTYTLMPNDALEVVFNSAVGDWEIVSSQVKERTAKGKAGRIVFMFDDGYESNFTLAYPIFKKYGFRATIAQEVDRVNGNYNGDANRPVLDADQLRQLVREGWEICNHPSLTTSDPTGTMLTKVVAENNKLEDFLTGELIAAEGGSVSTGSLTHPEFLGFANQISTAVYQGGARNDSSDMVFRYVFDKVRTIPGAANVYGDHLYHWTPQHEHKQLVCGWSADPGKNNKALFDGILQLVRGVAGEDETLVLYAHDVRIAPDTSISPFIWTRQLDSILAVCAELGLDVVTMREAYTADKLGKRTFNEKSWTFANSNPDGTIAWSTSKTYLGSSNSIHFNCPTRYSNYSTSATSPSFAVSPGSRYRITVAYRVDTELNIGGSGNINHGLTVGIQPYTGNNPNDSEPAAWANEWSTYNDVSIRPPYLATTGWRLYTVTLPVTGGTKANVTIAPYSASGQFWIGWVSVEKMESYNLKPLTLTKAFNTVLGSSIYLPGMNTDKWEVQIQANPTTTVSATYDYAYNDSRLVPDTTSGKTVYVLNGGAGSFVGKDGQVATSTGSSWTYTTPAENAFFKVNNFLGRTNVYVNHRFRFTWGSPTKVLADYDIGISQSLEDPIYWSTSGALITVWNASGKRSDNFTLLARPTVGRSSQ
jgi:hypothetical protein